MDNAKNTTVEHDIGTNELARLLGIVPHTAHRSYCMKGHYLGLRPVKLPNGRLRWSSAQVRQLTNGDPIQFDGEDLSS